MFTFFFNAIPSEKHIPDMFKVGKLYLSIKSVILQNTSTAICKVHFTIYTFQNIIILGRVQVRDDTFGLIHV